MIFKYKIESLSDDELSLLLYIINKYDPPSIVVDSTIVTSIRLTKLCKKLNLALSEIKEEYKEVLYSMAEKLGIQVNK